MNEEIIIERILESLSIIHNVKWLSMIYGFVKGFAEVEENKYEAK